MNTLKYQIKLWKLNNQRSKIKAQYKKKLQKAQKNRMPSQDIQEIYAEENGEISFIDDEIEELEHHHLFNLARKLLLPTSDFRNDDNNWEQSNITGQNRLSRSAMFELRSLIRKEKKERREGIIRWFSALIGFIGALSGLIAVWKS